MVIEINNCKDTDITIAVDLRERPSGLEDKLITKYGIKVVRKWLPVADFVVNNTIAVERKTSADFSKSIVDGRLFRQAAKMKLFFPLVLLIIEGKSLGLLDSNIHPHCIKGALVNLIVCWQIPILFSQDLDETALLLWLIGRQQTAKKRPFFLQKRKPKTSRFRQQAHILGELPGIGLSLSFRLLKYFGTVEKAMIAGEEELRQIRGIGPTKARKIKELITNCDHFNTSDKTSENKVDTHGLSPWNSALWVFRIFYQQAHKGRSGNPKG